jgi:putative pyruvate formate lyase activating enzyme
MKQYPSYLNLSENEFQNRIQHAYKHLECCRLCPHYCNVNRNVGQKGFW